MATEKPSKHKDVEALTSSSESIPQWKKIIDQGVTTPSIENHRYDGSGTTEDPYVVSWINHDPRNPMLWKAWYRWVVVLATALPVLTVSFASSAFSGGLPEILEQYGSSQEVGILGLSLFVLGFALGPLFWAPLSEMYGRQILFATTFGAYAIFNGGVAASQNMQTILILRFFAGAFGSSPLTNSGGVIADCFPARDRGLALCIFAAAPFLGPSLGPVIGGFLGEGAGWRWLTGFIALFSGVAWFIGMAVVPETYAPVLLRQRARKLSSMSGKVYRSKLDIQRPSTSLTEALKTALTRPWVLLIREPIVLIMSIYMAIVYGTLYMLFAAFPIVYQQGRGWSQGIGGLAFIGVLIGMFTSVAYFIWIENPRYQKVVDKLGGYAPPESRLPSAILGGVLLPIGLFWFSWTNSPSIHWAVSMAAGIPFGAGMVLVFLGIMNYLIDAYTIFAASVLAANSVLRSCFGAAFPLFTAQMYDRLGIHWASSIPAFLALACVPFPFLFWKYGAQVRAKCKFAAEADEFMKRLRNEAKEADDPQEDEDEAFKEVETQSHKESVEEEAESPSKNKEIVPPELQRPQFERIKTARSSRSRNSNIDWDDNPYVIDRVHTRESFKSRSRSASRASASRQSASRASKP